MAPTACCLGSRRRLRRLLTMKIERAPKAARFCFAGSADDRNESGGRGGTVDARDLKSLGVTPVPVRVRPPAPSLVHFAFWSISAAWFCWFQTVSIRYKRQRAAGVWDRPPFSATYYFFIQSQ